MNCLLTVAVIWATAVAPQLCRVGTLTACCPEAPVRLIAPGEVDDCARANCAPRCQEPCERPAPPDGCDGDTCDNFCDAVLKPADAGESTSYLCVVGVAALSDCILSARLSDDSALRRAVHRPCDLPGLPRPPSDFPLLN